MSLFECRTKFQNGKIEKSDYIDTMYGLHARLFEYSQYIKQTDISSIEIQDDCIIMTLRKSGIKLKCETLDKRVAPIEILNFNSYEKADASMILNLLDPQMVFFDIGANVGWYSMSVGKHDSSIQVYSFEPIPQTFMMLEKNISLNEFSNIKVFNQGLSDKNQKLVFYFDPCESGNASSRNLKDNISAKEIISHAGKLDDFVNEHNITQLDFIKCDVEGAELLVFKGGLDSISAYQPIIFTEMLRKWSKKFDYHPNEIIKLLAELGYRSFTEKNGQLIEFFTMDENTIQTNFFFLHSEKHLQKIQKLSV
jgi:FkbM family methyltransferase